MKLPLAVFFHKETEKRSIDCFLEEWIGSTASIRTFLVNLGTA
jgi:hypothetical protein